MLGSLEDPAPRSTQVSYFLPKGTGRPLSARSLSRCRVKKVEELSGSDNIRL